MLVERFSQRGEGWLSGAVAGRHIVHLPGVAQFRDDLFDVRIFGDYQMKPAGDDVDPLVD